MPDARAGTPLACNSCRGNGEIRLSPPDRFGPPYVRLKRSARLVSRSAPAIIAFHGAIDLLQRAGSALRFDVGEACRPNAIDADQIIDRAKRLDPAQVDEVLGAIRADVDDFV